MKIHIHHIAIWVDDLEKVRDFYCHYFGMSSGEKYENSRKQFTSYFLSNNGDNSMQIELMHEPNRKSDKDQIKRTGFAHLAFSVGSKENVDNLVERFRMDGFPILREPRTTGDGYYEAVIEDCEGNIVEIVE